MAVEGASPVDGDWTMPAHDYASTRYSGLADIDSNNVKDLTVSSPSLPVWTAATKARPWSSTVRMYIVAPYPNPLFALDLTKPGAR